MPAVRWKRERGMALPTGFGVRGGPSATAQSVDVCLLSLTKTAEGRGRRPGVTVSLTRRRPTEQRHRLWLAAPWHTDTTSPCHAGAPRLSQRGQGKVERVREATPGCVASDPGRLGSPRAGGRPRTNGEPSRLCPWRLAELLWGGGVEERQAVAEVMIRPAASQVPPPQRRSVEGPWAWWKDGVRHGIQGPR
ncbi:hypothetical protein CDD83_8743 [Cordyceps sp. RAO-2017]|nr:hypothetical protein CDD83_8743 [Cordyceps sp. RAO-2017]